jgi:haloalkane dehalogenase
MAGIKTSLFNCLALGLLLVLSSTKHSNSANSYKLVVNDTLFQKKYVIVNGFKMAYHEEGNGDPILFFHGNPTSSYEWRKIIPHINLLGRCIAHDMQGMGSSEKIPPSVRNRYTYEFHFESISKFIDSVLDKKSKIILVAHDWGAVLAIHWARLHPERVRGIAFMETFLEPLETGKSPSFAINWFKNWRSLEMEKAVLDSNKFVERVLFGDAGAYLSESDKEEYRRPYINKGDDRLPTLEWPRQVSIDSDPAFTHNVFVENMTFMSETLIPKLFINAEPGALLSSEARRAVIRKWPNLIEAKVKGVHFVQESSPNDIGKFLNEWINSLK